MNEPSLLSAAAAIQRPQYRPFTPITRPGVVVVSHERSGTHFLMNALVGVYRYAPFQDLDSTTALFNFFFPPLLAEAIAATAARQANSLFKSHHTVEFFDGVLDQLLKGVVILYIHRDPVDVMISFWRLIHKFPWREGPKLSSATAFARAEPEGQMLRYQMHQRRNMLDRWARHVEGWVNAAEGRPRLVVVRYDELLACYEETMRNLSRVLGAPIGDFQSPPRDKNVIKGMPPESLPRPDVEELRALALAEVGETMRKLRYA